MTEPKNTRLDYRFGHLNSCDVSNNIRYFDPEQDPLSTLARLSSEEHKPNLLLNLDSLKGIVLRNDPASTTSTSRQIAGAGDSKHRTLKVRIPELHSHLPDPLQGGNNTGCFQQLIDMYPSFEVPADFKGDAAQIFPGDIVIVRFENTQDMQGPIFVGLFQKGPGACYGDVDDEAKNKFGLSGDFSNPIFAERAQDILNERISSNFFVRDLAGAGDTAQKFISQNIPNSVAVENMRAFAENILEPVKAKFGNITINSGYRGDFVNSIVGGSKNSQHSKGEAADIEVPGTPNLELAQWINNNIPLFDQLILEDAEARSGNAGWVHVSYSRSRNRRDALSTHKSIRKSNGRRDYKKGISTLV